MEYVTDYLSTLQGIALNEPIFLKDLQPALQFKRLHEIPQQIDTIAMQHS